MSHLYITTVHVRSGDNTRVHVRGSIHVADEMGASDSIAVGLREFVHRTYSLLAQIAIDSLVGWRKTGIGTIGRHLFHHARTFQDKRELAEVLVAQQVVAYHLPLECIKVGLIRLIRAA